MKRITIIVMALFAFVGLTNAQVTKSYTFESSVGTYVEITGGAVVGGDITGTAEGNIALNGLVFNGSTTGVNTLSDAEGFPIGFDFAYDNQVMNRFAIGSNGGVFLGKDKVIASPVAIDILNTWGEGTLDVVGTIPAGTGNAVYAFPDTEISYLLSGTSPNRVLTVQYKNWGLAFDFTGAAKGRVNHQIRLYEGTNKIEFSYTGWDKGTTVQSKGYRVGLKGSIEGDVHHRSGANAATGWTATTQGENTNLMWSNTIAIADGLKFVFTPPADCVIPSEKASGLQMNATSTDFTGSFTPTATADHYLVVQSEQATLGATPVDGTYYKTGDNFGNGQVLSFDTTTEFASLWNEVLEGATTYYIQVFAVNSLCAGGPLYNTEALTGSVTTLPNAPASFAVTTEGYDHATLAVEANAANNQVLIAISYELGVDDLGNILNDGQFGVPAGTLNVGDAIPGGGVVIYKGAASGAIPVTDLTPDQFTHFAAWSLDDSGNYSSTVQYANVLPWGVVPYAVNFSQFGRYEAPWGWESSQHNSSDDFQIPRNQDNISTPANATPGSTYTLVTQWIKLAEGKNRLITDLAFTEYVNRQNRPYTVWNENDIFEWQVSTDGTDWTSIYTVNGANGAANLAVSQDFANFNGEKVKIRLTWTVNAAAKLTISKFKIMEASDCEYPVDLTVSGVVASQALIGWTAKGEEYAWDIRFRKVGDKVWNDTIEADSNPYLLTTLPVNSTVEVQVRAKCSLTSVGPWSETLTFTSGFGVPFSENFDNTTNNQLPSGWTIKSGAIGEPTVFSGTATIRGAVYNQLTFANNRANVNDWVILPALDLGDGSVNYNLTHTVTLSNEVLPPADNYLAAVISTDGGQTFNESKVLATYQTADEAFPTGSFTVSLKGYTGVVQIAYYFKTATALNGSASIELDNIAVVESCPPVVTNAQVSDITGVSAKVTWEGEADEWLVFVRQRGETTKDYQKLTVAELNLTDLTTVTNYEVGITTSCAEGDTARVTIVPFTTSSVIPCEEVEEVAIFPAQTSANIVWKAEALNYKVHFRLSGTEEWITRTSDTEYITLSGLTPDTQYEYTIQAICSEAEGDESDWLEVASFTTLPITCFAPTNIQIVPAHDTAVITWTGEAADYEVSYWTGSAAAISKTVPGAKTLTITDLTPETLYSVRIRSLCAADDVSAWSDAVTFTTLAAPVCVPPTNLQAAQITATSALLSWDADEENASWDVRHRDAAITSWTTVSALTTASYALEGLKANTLYFWSVRANCENLPTTAWVTPQGEFTTLDEVGIGTVDAKRLTVYANGKIINILNPENITIERVQLYDLAGALLQNFSVKGNENVLIPTALNQSAVIVKVYTNNNASTYKVLVK
ncbi:hypothetical protein FACS189474_4490 [Bacteroidia bacterium]|nr:hypothetical protein FACS189474_4490 [Bacteroidia bacterium]